jgi:F-box/WD-40 domain protein MET30
MPFDLAGKTLSPFLKEHIPGQYAPVGKNLKKEDHTGASNALVNIKDPNTKYCYRHRPDSKCRRAADETKMGTIQRVCLWKTTIQPLLVLSDMSFY